MIIIDEKTRTRLDRAQSCLTELALETTAPEPHRIDVTIEALSLLPAAQALSRASWGYLSAVTGLDRGVESGVIEVLYHFCEGAAIVTLRVSLPRDHASIASVYSIFPSARFFERELSEMLGVRVDGIPNSDHLFLPDDWPEGVYPLRKDFVSQEVDQ